jgi:hypothetical protein
MSGARSDCVRSPIVVPPTVSEHLADLDAGVDRP